MSDCFSALRQQIGIAIRMLSIVCAALAPNAAAVLFSCGWFLDSIMILGPSPQL
jgi:hypothetical protein